MGTNRIPSYEQSTMADAAVFLNTIINGSSECASNDTAEFAVNDVALSDTQRASKGSACSKDT